MKKLIITVACAVAVSVLFAQEMGATATEVAAGATDQGAEVAAQADAKAGELTVVAPSDEFVSAEELVEKNLEKMDLYEGYDPKRRAIIAIGTVKVSVADPANDGTFMTIRSGKAIEAYIEAQRQVIEAINTKMSAMDRALTIAEYGNDEPQKAFVASRNALEVKREALAKKLEQLDKAEADALRGVTMTDRFGAVLEGIAKKLDEKFNTAAILAQKKAVCDQLKMECSEMMADYKVLEEKAQKIPVIPQNELQSTMKMKSQMPLLGSSVLTQAEAWDKENKVYQMSMAIVWSQKLQENAVSLINGDAVSSSKPGPFTPQQWIAAQNLATMIGPRRFVDSRGNNIFVGIAACDLTGQVMAEKAKKRMTDMEARKAVAFSLAGDIVSYSEATKNIKGYNDDLKTQSGKLRDVVARQLDINLQGCLKLKHKEIRHPISGRMTYVSVFYIDPALSKDASEFLKKSYAGLVRQIKTTQYRRGQHAGMGKALDNQRKSTAEFNNGVADGAQGVASEVQRQQSTAKQQKKSVLSSATGSKRQATTGQSQGGTFSGDSTIDTDF